MVHTGVRPQTEMETCITQAICSKVSSVADS